MATPASAAAVPTSPPKVVEAIQIPSMTRSDLNRIMWLLDKGRYELTLREHEEARKIVKMLEERRDLMRQIEERTTNAG